MSEVPGDTLPTIPEVGPIVATALLLPDHKPPAVLLSVVLAPRHIVVAPVMEAGKAITVAVATVRHEPPNE
jgi:hypothetical protein